MSILQAMGMEVIKPIMPPEELVRQIPVSKKAKQRVKQNRKAVRSILSGKDPRMLVIVGPCSAWPHDAVIAYARRLAALQEKVADTLKLVMRVYIQKPRTTKGWTGPLTQPDPFAPPDIEAGMKYSRRLMVEIIEMGLPIADEAVFTHNAPGFLELLSWVAIGARSSEDQEHRIFASFIDCPVGVKNPTSGSITLGVNSVIAAQHGHTTVLNGSQVETNGNAFAHLVLRGGKDGPNYSLEEIQYARKLFEKYELKNPAVVIDASHDNARVKGIKDPLQQTHVVHTVLDELQKHPELREFMKGFMLESFLLPGCQKVEEHTRDTLEMGGLSITDPCLSFEETEVVISRMHEMLV